MQLSVQGYLQQRKRLNPEIFPYLNRKYLMDFYRSDEPRLWKGYLLIAIDGSKAEVPNSKEQGSIWKQRQPAFRERAGTGTGERNV